MSVSEERERRAHFESVGWGDGEGVERCCGCGVGMCWSIWSKVEFGCGSGEEL